MYPSSTQIFSTRLMKKTKFLILVTFLFSLTYSCSSDDNKSNPDDDLAQQQNETENRKIPIAEIESGISINGATKISGLPPAPNGVLDLQIATNKHPAFQVYGFNAEFSSTGVIEGAYLLFTDSDGVKAGSYFDVPVSAFAGKKGNTKNDGNSIVNKLSVFKSSTANTDYVVDVDFDNIGPGSFCYEICLYDANGNISYIETVCVTVEAWGGNSEIIGEWLWDRSEPEYNPSNITSIDCGNGQSIETESTLYDKNELTYIFDSEGNFEERTELIFKHLDRNISKASCTAIYGETEEFFYSYSGKWSYLEEEGILQKILFLFEDTYNYVPIEQGAAYVGFTAEIIAGELVLTTVEEIGPNSEIKTYYLKRK